MKESKIQRKIIDYLQSIGCYAVKTVSATKSGVPDILCCHNGRFIAIEVKTDIGIVSALQEINIEIAKKAGAIAFVARNLDDVKKEIF